LDKLTGLNADANVGGLVGINDNFTVGSGDGLNAVAGTCDGFWMAWGLEGLKIIFN